MDSRCNWLLDMSWVLRVAGNSEIENREFSYSDMEIGRRLRRIQLIQWRRRIGRMGEWSILWLHVHFNRFSYGQLTAAGIEQHHRLGQYFRTRYGSIISPLFHPDENYVRSTDNDRTLMSEQANLIGFYPLFNVSGDKVPVQPVPIHTAPMEDDFVREYRMEFEYLSALI